MSKEYVPREEVIKILETYDLCDSSILGYHSGAIECAIYEIEMLPAADVVEVVRCERCFRRGLPECAMSYGYDCKKQRSWETDNDFCSWGGRKTDG